MQRGILADAASSPIEQYLHYTLTGETPLATRRVSIVGAGPVGARIAHGLAQHGLGGITLLDDRATNALWYAFQPFARNGAEDHRRSDQVLSDTLAGTETVVQALDAQLDLRGLQAAVETADLTVLALEEHNLQLAHLLNRVCLKANKPWMIASTDGNLGLAGPLFLPRETACYNCYAALAEAATISREMGRRIRQQVIARGAGSFFPGLPVFADIVAGYATLAAVHFLLGKQAFLTGRVLTVNFDRMLVQIEDVLRLPRCPVCGLEKSIYRPAFNVGVAGPA